MPEAVIVATSRTPIGRANKGSLVDVRPDDMAATFVKALSKGAGARSEPRRGRDLGQCGNLVAKPATTSAASWASSPGSTVPGTTVNRYCSSSLQTIRMAASRDQGRRG